MREMRPASPFFLVLHYRNQHTMKQSNKILRFLFAVIIVSQISLPVYAWSEHPLLVRPALKTFINWEQQEPVAAISLQAFLLEVEHELEQFLREQETWSRANLPNYAPRPDELAFKATGNPDDILERFFMAIRVNPNIKVPLYLHLLPNDDPGNRPLADPAGITTLSNIGSMQHTTYVWLAEGELVSAFDVLTTANDEPDYGFDLGLFEDNHTEYGQVYGFGAQPFGNPNLEYSSQAPFHMAFYHESWILYKAGPFLKHTFLDYRINLYKMLSEFAFAQNQPYWGWRFMGWGMHYVGDVSMPYHSKPLPGVSTLRMLWINLKAILGFPQSRDNAVQLVSNKHAVYEEFQVQVLRMAHVQNNWQHPFIHALMNPKDLIPFSGDFIVEVAARESVARSGPVDRALKKYMPAHMVSDPSVEVSDLPELNSIAQLVEAEMGKEAYDQLVEVIAERMESYSMHIRSFLLNILEKAEGS